jgi:hypothetical protein
MLQIIDLIFELVKAFKNTATDNRPKIAFVFVNIGGDSHFCDVLRFKCQISDCLFCLTSIQCVSRTFLISFSAGFFLQEKKNRTYLRLKDIGCSIAK